MRAPPRRAAGASKSKWLREEGDGEWGNSYGKDNLKQQNPEQSIPSFMRAVSPTLKRRDCSADSANISGVTGGNISNSNVVGGNANSLNNNGPEEEELDGLSLEERKRRRSEAHGFISTGINKETSSMDSVLSNGDCSESHTQSLATLAQQASQQQ